MTPGRNVSDMAASLTGHLENGVHSFPLRVYYEDTDAGGIVYYANYLRFAERARTEMMHLLDAGYRAQGGSASPGDIAFTVRHLEADYTAPARLDDLLEVRTTLKEVGGASLLADQGIHRDGASLVRLSVKLACINSRGSPTRLPPGLKEALLGISNLGS